LNTDILVNDDIPRTMTREGLVYLGRLARSVPENGVIVEVGPLFGSSTWVLAKNAHPSVRVISIDTWEPAAWVDKIEAKFPGCHPFSKDAFLHYVADCQNVEPIQGFSPDVMKDWSDPIDLFFDDATHGDPGFSDSLNFYVPLVKTGGVICGDDYASGWPDIVRGVRKLAKDLGGAEPEVIGRVWAMVKPDCGRSVSITEHIGMSDDGVRVKVKSSEKGWITAGSGVWAGQLHCVDSLTGLEISAQTDDRTLHGFFQVRDLRGRLSAWTEFGNPIETNAPIAALRGHLTGPDSLQYEVQYQVCEVDLARRKTANSKLITDCRWSNAERLSPICAARFLLRRMPSSAST
jgi:hypothetical protein